jgi:hypothetical protein
MAAALSLDPPNKWCKVGCITPMFILRVWQHSTLSSDPDRL